MHQEERHVAVRNFQIADGSKLRADRRQPAGITIELHMTFRVLILGGTGQVGAAVVRALVAEPSCAEVVMVNRKTIPLTANLRSRQVILDTAAVQFPGEVTTLARSIAALGDPVYGASCVGVGKGSNAWSEEELRALEIGVVGGLPVGAMPEALLGLRCSRQWEAQRKVGFAMCESWG